MPATVLTRLAAAAVVLAGAAPVLAQPDVAVQRLGRDVLQELIETNTTHSTGDTTIASAKMAARLVAAGFPEGDVVVVGGTEKRKNLVARYRGRGAGARPVLFSRISTSSRRGARTGRSTRSCSPSATAGSTGAARST